MDQNSERGENKENGKTNPDFDSQINKSLQARQVILDLSTFPYLEKILSSSLGTEQSKNIGNNLEYYIPDTIPILLGKAKENPNFYRYLLKLFSRWGIKKDIDMQYLNKIFVESKTLPSNIKLIHVADVDKKLFDHCNETIEFKGLSVEFSPKFNIIGNVIGLILGYAHKANIPIIMFNQKLIEFVKSIPIITNNIVQLKQDFFSKIIPRYELGKGVRFFIGFILTIAGEYRQLPFISEVGVVLCVIDP